MIEVAIGIGLTLSLIVSEVFGVASAGLVVPGYLALYLDQPWRLAATFLVALSTLAVVRTGSDGSSFCTGAVGSESRCSSGSCSMPLSSTSCSSCRRRRPPCVPSATSFRA